MSVAKVSSGRKSDYCAYMVGGQSENNNLKYARWAELAKINARTDFDRYIDHMIELLKRYPEGRYVYIEKNTFYCAYMVGGQSENNNLKLS